ncbi:FAD-dependent monooxygenase [Ornithinicoccus halotolerans]|uniref:FAD-dependent monooxygenase n=1 Tax=Ornithinicoccus halotolerans TaxID=1748220 RepID=UPI0012948C1E|nr:FAD-dependent monooxygenase [Ornithinicoccus halotolerans]
MKALICGAGIAGLTLAQRLTSYGWEVTVVERAPGPRQQGYMLDFFGLGYDAAEAMGLLPRLHQLGYRVDELTYVDRSGRRRAGLDYSRFARLLDGRLLSLLRPDLEQALRELVEGHVVLRYGCTVASMESVTNGVHVVLDDGTVLDVDLLVGADGIHSQVRGMLFGQESRFLRYLGLHTAAYVFDDPDVRRRIGNRFSLTDTADRQMGLYGLRDGRVAAFAVHRDPDPVMPADPRAAVQSTYSPLGWVVPSALENCPPPSELYYDLVAQVEVPQWHRGRVVLVGDACQAVSLLAGQGASLAVAGAYHLAELLAAEESVDDALERYQRTWKPVVEAKQAAGRRGATWFLPSSRARLWLRRISLLSTALPGWDRLAGSTLVGKTHLSLDDIGTRDSGGGSPSMQRPRQRAPLNSRSEH